jgi:hypothetical protein
MGDDRNKTVRIDDELSKAIKTLSGYFDVRNDEIVATAVRELWARTFPNVPMPGEAAKGKGRK